MSLSPNLADDLARIALQEERLQFEKFTATTAWELGHRLKAAAEARQGAVAIDIQLANQPLFFLAMPGTTPDNQNWIRRKRNVTRHFHRSSYAIGLELQQRRITLWERSALPPRHYAPFGGCFPVRLKGVGFVGTIAVSGLPQREDHQLIVAVLADWLNQPLGELTLNEPSSLTP